MSRRRAASRHGDPIAAPQEAAGLDDSPQPPVTRSTPPEPGGVGRQIWSLTQLAVGLVLVVGVSVGVAWGARHYALNTPRFAIHEIEVEGNVRRSERDIANAAGVEVGQNILALDADRAERLVLEDPWVREVKITRQLPNRLRIDVVERQAGAVAAIDGRLVLVTTEGEPFCELGEGDPFDLPLVTGISAELLGRDRGAAVERLQLALRAIRNYQRLPVSRIHVVQEVHVGDDGQVVLTIGKDGITLHLGHDPTPRRFLMAARVLGILAQRGQTPGIVFLDNKAHPERVVARMR